MYKGIPSIEGARKFFVAYCDKGRISVRWDKSVTVPHAIWDKHSKSGRIVTNVPALHTFGDWLFKAHHEAGHLREEVIFTYDVMERCERHVERDIANILADYLDEYNCLGEFPGHDRILFEGRRDMLATMKGDFAKIHPGIGALFEWDTRDRREWQGMMPELKQHKDWPIYLARYDELNLERRLPKLLDTRSVEDMWHLVLMISEMVLAPITEEERERLKKEKEMPKPKRGAGSAGDGKGRGVGSGDPDKADEVPEDSDGMGSGSEKSDDSEDTGGEPDSVEDESPETKAGGEEEDEEESPTVDKESDTEETPSRDGDLEKSELPDEIKGLEETPAKEHSHSSEWYKPFEKHIYILPNYRVNTTARENIARKLAGSTVSKRIKRYLKIVSKDSHTYGHKTGKLHTKNIHRIYTGQEEPRIFKKKDRAILKTDSAISLLLDCSGSMGGSRYFTGAACCIAIAQTLVDLRIVHEVAGFSETGSLWTYMFKRFDQNISKEKLLNGFSSGNIRLSQNADGESVLAAAERLAERKEKHKLLIVMSDGYPCGTYTGNGNWYLREVCKTIEKSGEMDLLGIGIQTESVARFYKDNAIVNNINDLDRVLFEHLKRQLT